ncbi:MAG: Flp family type IVb pilin [Candidatus Eisenbacteria bacterium]|nr:Flp family type IVb pilin [Candidatus Eisenbacteria bacterium]
MKFLKNLFKNEKGAAVTEYALLIALVAIAVISAIILLRDELIRVFTLIAGKLGEVPGS